MASHLPLSWGDGLPEVYFDATSGGRSKIARFSLGRFLGKRASLCLRRWLPVWWGTAGFRFPGLKSWAGRPCPYGTA